MNEVLPYLYCFRLVASVDMGIMDGFGPLPYRHTVCQLLDDLFKLRVLLELFVLLVVIHWP